jgi:hypothetical protein
MRCKGRLVSDIKGVGTLPFENGGSFHIPLRCDRVADDLCEQCKKRKLRTDEKVAGIHGISLQGTHPSYLHGCIDEPTPFWSHIYDGAWFRLKVEEGSIVSSETMARAKAAAVAAGVAAVEPVPLPTGGKKGRKKAGTAVAPVAPVPAPTVTKAPKRAKKQLEPEALEPVQPIALLKGPPLEIENVIHIQVKRVEIGQRPVYLDSKTQKVYDLKCKYIGRYDTEKESIVSFPDSDAE